MAVRMHETFEMLDDMHKRNILLGLLKVWLVNYKIIQIHCNGSAPDAVSYRRK